MADIAPERSYHPPPEIVYSLPHPAVTHSTYHEDKRTLFQKGRDHINRDAILRLLGKARYYLFTHDGFIGKDVDYKSFFIPSIPFTRWKAQKPHFFGVYDEIPLLLIIILGFQHALAMMGGLISPSLIFGSVANLETADINYLVSAALITSGLTTLLQVCRFRIPYTKYYIGTGLLTVLGESFTTVTVFSSTVPTMYERGFCPKADDGTELPCREAYGAFLATGALCALLEVVLSFVPPKALKKIFPPLVTGPVVLLIGASLVQSGMEDFGGGSGCYPDDMCSTGTKEYKWGSGQWIGLGFSCLVTIFFCDRFGSPMMKTSSIILGLLVSCIIAGACGYFDHTQIDQAPSGQFNWVRTFPLKLYGPSVLPLLAVYICATMETIGDITATADVSKVPCEGEEFESRVQGGVLASGLGSIYGCLATTTPISSFGQSCAIVNLSQCASPKAGVACSIWLILFGVIGKFSATIVAIPDAVIGGITTAIFSGIATAGLSIISMSSFNRRNRVVLTNALIFGFGSLLVPTWFSGVFTYKGDNSGKQGFLDCITIIVETPYAIAGIVGCVVNLIMPEDKSEDGVVETIDADAISIEREDGKLESRETDPSVKDVGGKEKNIASFTSSN